MRVDDGFLILGDHRFPCTGGWESDDVMNGHFHTRRARLKFESGYELSVVFGTVTYCANRDRHGDAFQENCPDCEIALWDRDGRWHYWAGLGDTVRGWVSEADLLEIIDLLAVGDWDFCAEERQS